MILVFLPCTFVLAEDIIITDADVVWTPNLNISSDVTDSTDAPNTFLPDIFFAQADVVWLPSFTPVPSNVLDAVDAPVPNLPDIFISHFDVFWQPYFTVAPSEVFDSSDAPEPILTEVFVSAADVVWSAELRKEDIGILPPEPEPEPSIIWFKVSNTPTGIWNLRQTPGTINKPNDDILKIVPQAWVFKLLSKTNENNQVINKDGYIWWQVENPGNSIIGWIAAQKSDGSAQYLMPDNASKAEVLDIKESRTDAILQAVDNYYNSTDTHSADYSSTDLYKSNDWGYNVKNPPDFRDANNISYLKDNQFPVELTLAIIAQESGIFEFDNEVYDQWYATVKQDLESAGVGIMQLHGSEIKLGWDSKSWGSNLKCYKETCKKAYLENNIYKHKYYSNSRQAIYANIKDGLKVLQRAYCDSKKTNFFASDIIQWIGAIWRYNHGPSPEKGITIKDKYLVNVAKKIDWEGDQKLEIYFNDYKTQLSNLHTHQFLSTEKRKELAEKMRNYKTGEIMSPVELRIYDSQGQVTGLVNGEVKNEIPNSDYYEGKFLILSTSDPYDYQVVGLEQGEYGLRLTSVGGENSATFVATGIPILSQEVHQYTVDWDKLAQGENGVSLQIDSNADGVFENTITAGATLNNDDITVQTKTVVDFNPDTLNLESKGKVVTIFIELPEGFDVNKVDISSVLLNNTIQALSEPAELGDYDNDAIHDLMVKFARDEVENILDTGEQIPLVITGKVLHNSQYLEFKGNDTIRVIK